MATTIAAWVWAARGNQPRAEEIIALLAAGRAYPVVAEEWGFTEAHLETLKSQIAARLQKDALGRQQLIYDAPLNLGGLLTQINSPQANPVAENEEKYQLQKEVVSYGRNYVTTEISAETDLTAEFELTWLGGTDTQVIAGARSKEGFVMLAGIRQGKWVYACSRDRSFVDTGVSVKKGVKTRLKVVLSAGRQSFEVDGVLVKESALEGASTGLPLRLLGLNDQGVFVAGARARLHRAKIYRATAHE